MVVGSHKLKDDFGLSSQELSPSVECQDPSPVPILKRGSNNGNPRPPLLPAAEAAKRLGIAEQTLAVWRSTGRYSLAFVKIGRRVMYRESVLEAFIEANTHTQTG